MKYFLILLLATMLIPATSYAEDNEADLLLQMEQIKENSIKENSTAY